MAEDRRPDDAPVTDTSTHETEELTMDERPTSATRPEVDTPTASGSTAGSTRHTDDDAPWSVPAGAAPAVTATTQPEVARGVRVGTVVWGLVVIVAGGLLAAAAAGVVFDVQLAVIVTVALAGVALVLGSLVSASRRRDQRV